MSLNPPTEACRVQSEALGEMLMGTAPHAEHWLLLQYDGPWGNKALEESDLDATVQSGLKTLIAQVPRTRLGLIKQTPAATRGVVLAISCRPQQPTMFQYVFDNLGQLTALDATELFAGRAPGARQLTAPVYLVCTNGKRDPCCAAAGLPLYRKLSALRPGQVWQTTHVGGHRFAGILGCFPEGLLYGRLDETTGLRTVELHEARRMDLDHCRGRSAFPEPVQAAEILLRQAWGQDNSELVQAASYSSHGEQTQVSLSLTGGEVVDLEVHGTRSGAVVPGSCGSSKGEPKMEYRLAQVPAMRES
jgi:hypothetical protein